MVSFDEEGAEDEEVEDEGERGCGMSHGWPVRGEEKQSTRI
jgi:hypothetical protein